MPIGTNNWDVEIHKKNESLQRPYNCIKLYIKCKIYLFKDLFGKRFTI